MDMQEKINGGYYVTKLPYPEKPKDPVLIGRDVASATQYALDKQAYWDAMDAYKKERKAYQSDETRLTSLFATEAIADVFGEDADRFPNLCGVLYNLAYEHGHSSGLSEVYNYLQEFQRVTEAVHEDLGER